MRNRTRRRVLIAQSDSATLRLLHIWSNNNKARRRAKRFVVGDATAVDFKTEVQLRACGCLLSCCGKNLSANSEIAAWYRQQPRDDDSAENLCQYKNLLYSRNTFHEWKHRKWRRSLRDNSTSPVSDQRLTSMDLSLHVGMMGKHGRLGVETLRVRG